MKTMPVGAPDLPVAPLNVSSIDLTVGAELPPPCTSRSRSNSRARLRPLIEWIAYHQPPFACASRSTMTSMTLATVYVDGSIGLASSESALPLPGGTPTAIGTARPLSITQRSRFFGKRQSVPYAGPLASCTGIDARHMKLRGPSTVGGNSDHVMSLKSRSL